MFQAHDMLFYYLCIPNEDIKLFSKSLGYLFSYVNVFRTVSNYATKGKI